MIYLFLKTPVNVKFIKTKKCIFEVDYKFLQYE